MFTQPFDARLAVARLHITLGPHVVVHFVQVVIKLLAIENVLFAKARDQSGFLNVLHLVAQLAALENLAAFEPNFGYANARAFTYFKSDCI